MYQSTPSRDIADQRILQFYWTSGTIGHSQSKVADPDTPFTWSLFSCKKMVPSRDTDYQRILQFDWPRSIPCQHTIIVILLSTTVPHDHLYVRTLIYQLILSRDIDDQRILQSDWMWDISGHTQPKVVVSDAAFLWCCLPSISMHKI